MNTGSFMVSGLEEGVDVVYVIEAVVEEEFELGDDAGLLADFFPEDETDGFVLLGEGGQDVRGPVGREDTEVDAGVGEVGTDADGGDGEDGTEGEFAAFFLEHFAEVSLDEPGDFILSDGIHDEKNWLYAKFFGKDNVFD